MFSVVLYLYQGQGKQDRKQKEKRKTKMKKETILFTLVCNNTPQYFDNREDAKKAFKELKDKNLSPTLCKTITTIETLTLDDNVGLWR